MHRVVKVARLALDGRMVRSIVICSGKILSADEQTIDKLINPPAASSMP